MLDTSIDESTNIVKVTYAGSLRAAEMEQLRDQLSAMVARRGSVRLLAEVGDLDLGRMPPRAIWEDLKLLGLFDDLDRYALVADHEWIARLADAASAAVPFELRAFSSDSRDAALDWLRE